MGKVLIPSEMVSGEYLFKRYGATVEDYDRAAEEDTRLELIDGILVMHSPASVRHERIFGFLLSLLQGYANKTRAGIVLGSRTPMFLEEDQRFEPDLLFIQQRHLDRLGETALVGPADLVVEILSTATRDYDLNEKRNAYAAGAVPEFWIVDPMASVFLADRPAGTRQAELVRGRYESESLPSFWLDVEWLWQEPLPDAGECLAKILAR
jgi:Uma2 family endonuclease